MSEILGEQTELVAPAFLERTPVGTWTPLAGFAFRLGDLVARIGRDEAVVRALIAAFAAPTVHGNRGFTAMDAYNAAYAQPLIPLGRDVFVLLQPQALADALYTSPYYWMQADAAYRETAAQHRGEFTERFCAACLARVFGEQRVHGNVEGLGATGSHLGEIDVLVLFGDRAVVVEAKSKRLTMAARHGNDAALEDDFKKAVGLARPAGLSKCRCAATRRDEAPYTGWRVSRVERAAAVGFPITVLCDGYSALSAQSPEFLEEPEPAGVARAMVTDLLYLDDVTEMLASPLRLLSFLEHRAQCGERLFVENERTALAMHLKQNLWLSPDYDAAVIHEGVCMVLDAAPAVRREDVPGKGTPEGILTRFEGTAFCRLIAENEGTEQRAAVGLGLMLLRMSDETVENLNTLIDTVVGRTAKDGRSHDGTISLGTGLPGVTIQCSKEVLPSAEEGLYVHCRLRKYSQHEESWFGVLLGPEGSLRLAAELSDRWVYGADLERELPVLEGRKPGGRKIRRNERCPCGSGKKCKRCCLLLTRG